MNNIKNNPSELWVRVTNYPDYEVSNLGRVISYRNNKEGRLLKVLTQNSGYLRWSFTNEDGNKCMSCHRVIAIHFIPNPLNHPVINHINGIKTDNRIDNLEWCTIKENTQHAYKMGLNPTTDKKREILSKCVSERVGKGENNRFSKKVINTATGDIYNTLSDAAASVGMLTTTLSGQLLGKVKNKTSLKYLD